MTRSAAFPPPAQISIPERVQPGGRMVSTDVAAFLPVPLDAVISTEALIHRTARKPDFEALSNALIRLAKSLVSSPSGILQELVQSALELCSAHSAGISLLEEENGKMIFRWHAIAGRLAPHLWGTTPREFSPCGTVLDTDAVQLMSGLDRHFTYLATVEPRVVEALLIPFHVGGVAAGTIWVISHDRARQFDAEDARVITVLGEFASAAYQALSETLVLKSVSPRFRIRFWSWIVRFGCKRQADPSTRRFS